MCLGGVSQHISVMEAFFPGYGTLSSNDISPTRRIFVWNGSTGYLPRVGSSYLFLAFWRAEWGPTQRARIFTAYFAWAGARLQDKSSLHTKGAHMEIVTTPCPYKHDDYQGAVYREEPDKKLFGKVFSS